LPLIVLGSTNLPVVVVGSTNRQEKFEIDEAKLSTNIFWKGWEVIPGILG